MKTKLITAPSVAPVTVTELKAHCRVTFDDDDVYIQALLDAAIMHLEGVAGRKFITQKWKLFLDAWPGGAEIVLPYGDCSAVDSITYKDRDGVQATWASSKYVVDTDSVPGRVVIAYDESWPAETLYNVNPIEVIFDSGYGGTADDIPEDLKHAIKFLVCHWYENREVITTGTIVAPIPKTVDALIWKHRLFV